MLVLTRKKNESIIIDEHIEITILEVSGDQIKIGINAPKKVEIIRKEILEKVESENQKARTTSLNLDMFK
ncbi:carbon storage regulator [Robertmurraya yapensis]|uniref:Translational regulator CsrA n=1 Tax=Bacillus yapensis TaxID=2492960 RepID=A0A431WLM8_9BACI|nr:carbon storage regulator CsrA [Bacillus yapensis]RTR36371.1 carbon storage regulator [Bacillus yapensis]TKT05875.1 carbon storage regulator CsrA [Bacillus yapensis]